MINTTSKTLYDPLSILRSIRDAVMVADIHGKICFVNDAAGKLFGYVSEDLLGKYVENLIPYININKEKKLVESVLREEEIEAYETERIDKNNNIVYVLVSLSALKDGEGTIIGFTNVLRTVRHTKKLERSIPELPEPDPEIRDYALRLEIANKELEQFAYIASHDLQEQLRNITNYVGLIEKYSKVNADEDFQYFLSVISKSSDRMSTLIQELLEYSRIGRNRVVEKVDFRKVLTEVLTDMDVIIREKQASIYVDDLPVINSSEIEIKQLFQHLLSNALIYKGEYRRSEIYFKCEDKQTEWEFTVSDNGIGIREEYLQKIFLVFRRLHSEEEYPGIGIGLAICKKIISLNRGVIWASSKPGIGSVFYFTIPKQSN